MEYKSKMFQEIKEIPDSASNLLDKVDSQISQLISVFIEQQPNFITTVARGSSDHAATFLKYLFEIQLGLPVASLAPSTSSIYESKISLKNAVCFGISQSGESPDLLSVISGIKNKECITTSFTNNADSPLAQKSKFVISLHAGREESVAATKTFVNSLIVCLVLVAKISKDEELLNEIYKLPKILDKAIGIQWPDLKNELANCNHMYTLGRGISHAISNEAALKLIETCGIHASSYSSAEILHGPIEIVEENFPVLAFISRDAAEQSISSICENLVEKKARVFGTSNQLSLAKSLDFVKTGHPFTDPVALIASFYIFIEDLAVSRSRNPDQPRLLQKVTKTI